MVLIPGVGEVRFGARRWFDLGITLIQPSEFAKLAFIFALADFLTRPNEEMLMPGVFFKAIGMTALPFLLILKQPDLGSSLVFFPIGTAMMFVAGVRLLFLIKFLGFFSFLAVFVRFWQCFRDPRPSKMRFSWRRGAIFQKLTFFRPYAVLE